MKFDSIDLAMDGVIVSDELQMAINMCDRDDKILEKATEAQDPPSQDFMKVRHENRVILKKLAEKSKKGKSTLKTTRYNKGVSGFAGYLTSSNPMGK